MEMGGPLDPRDASSQRPNQRLGLFAVRKPVRPAAARNLSSTRFETLVEQPMMLLR